MNDPQLHRPPSYYIRKRLLQNKPAMFGMTIIITAHVIALLGYLIMPDQTPDAKDGDFPIRKQPPVFSCQVLKMRKNMDVPRAGFLERIYFGQESRYTIVTLAEKPSVRRDSVYFQVYGEANDTESIGLIDCVKPLFVGSSSKLGGQERSTNAELFADGDSIRYLDNEEQLHTLSLRQLEDEFWQRNVEQRTYLLGTDKSGRDILSRLLYGTRISLSIGFTSVLLSLLIGVVLGSLAGFFGGWVDDVITWLMTVVFSIPGIMLVIAISLVLQSRGLWVAFVAVGLTMWVETARVVRGQILGIKEKQFVEAARAFGFSNRRIIFRHILPNILGPLIVISTANFASAILIEAGLSFLGLGVQPPTPSWGMMIFEGFKAVGTTNSWHLVLFPSLSISLMVLAFNLFGNGLRDAYDPKALR